MYEYSEIGIYFNRIFSISIQNLTKCPKTFDFRKMSEFSSKNVRDLGSQDPDFLHVWWSYSEKASLNFGLPQKNPPQFWPPSKKSPLNFGLPQKNLPQIWPPSILASLNKSLLSPFFEAVFFLHIF